MSEATYTNIVRLALADRCTLFRNNVGACRTDRGRFIKYGLHPGSADFIGWTRHDGRAVFVSVEVKGAQTPIATEQKRWADNVNKAGGIGLILREGDDAAALFDARYKEVSG